MSSRTTSSAISGRISRTLSRARPTTNCNSRSTFPFQRERPSATEHCTNLSNGFARTSESSATGTRIVSCRWATLTWPMIASGEPRQGSIANSTCCTGRLRRSYHESRARSRSGLSPLDDLEGPRTDRLKQAFSRKCPKLQTCKTQGARTVLVLESSDSGLMSFEFRGGLLPSLLSGCESAPDEIFLVETCTDLWWVRLIKRDDGHWPDTGMPEFNRIYYEPDKSPLTGIPDWMRDALRLEDMYTPFLPGWAPATFEKDELDDLTAG